MTPQTPKLVIGRKNHFITEQFISGDDSPEFIRQKLIDLFGVELNEEDTRYTDSIEFPDKTITTFSPYVISTYARLCNFGERGGYNLSNVFLHYKGKDYRVVDFVEVAWLRHFDLGELYTDLELQAKLGKWLSEKV